jgi:hypothetical protein
MTLKEQVLVAVEIAAKKMINDKADGVIDMELKAIEKLVEKYPVVIAAIESAKAKIDEVVKAELLKLADHISPNV